MGNPDGSSPGTRPVGTNNEESQKQQVGLKSTTVSPSSNTQLPSSSCRKKRLSRKEQKARKQKQKRQKQQHQTESNPSKTREEREKEKSFDGDTATQLDTYVPILIPGDGGPTNTTHAASSQKKSLGKWFPKAVVIKSPQNISTGSDCCLLLFYQYVSPPWPDSRVSLLMAYLEKIAQTRSTLGGRIRVAPEGLNATLSCLDTNATRTLQHFCQDLKRFDSVFEQTDFKMIPRLDASRHFKDMKLLPVKELVFYGISNTQAPLDKGGVHLEPTKFHEMLSSENTVVVDVRNHYEAAIGRFDGQEDGAEYIDPRMRKSTDFATWLSKPATQEKLQDKKVMMFCTGGVRCERASAYLNQQMGSSVKGIYQLQGGIEKYLQTYKDGGYWRGKNFVFDKREAISAENREGDGGVVTKKKVAGVADTVCCVCSKPWDRYIGKKKCDTCGVPILMCDTCMSQSKNTSGHKKSDERETKNLARCPLCVEEGITVPATEVEYTNNGVSGRTASTAEEKRAAPSVLKWGGGHAYMKKEKRRMKRKLCRFGAECVRKDCFFAHPERETTPPPKQPQIK